ncbi:MAG TPA: Rne/Rng family ribonuclease [Novosphingobium sp.]|nr:Rne/Rng family ribonuclease [Novosphingobium sp.]
MATRMLIDARHTEETRVAVLKGNRIEEFDFESADRKQIKGNIYLAKVTRVEPSLQAAFVDFGGNRHGFLAFSEIHPDYYQIPKADRDALLAEEAAHAEEEAALRAADDQDDELDDADAADGDDEDIDDAGGLTEVDTSEKDEVSTIEAGHVENGDDNGDYGDDDDSAANGAADNSESEADGDGGESRSRGRGRRRQGRGRSKEADDLHARRMALRRRYKIQDVIHRRQVLLVQVVKEERGNKGAALTTYLSLAGRYCVLMPNSSHGGGISRKISSTTDRKRLKSIIAELNLPKSMGCIVRTAGLSRTKTEIKRDFDYLARLWDGLRETTLRSAAPTLIHSDSDLIKRAIRDIYNRDIEEVVVEGEDGYRAARAFMKLLMPSHVRKVKPYSDPVPLFQRYGAEDQLTAMYDPVVQLKSGGYIVINPTEALVSIDINSGRSTKEHGIEATAVRTNLEAAHEIARQLRLRDMAGLVVIDFIDMEFGSNVRKVEKAMKDSLKSDRARIQIGRISSFGLMEMSRQRLRTGVLEATTRGCPHCDGTGLVRTASSAGLSALRLIEDEAAKGKGTVISLFASTEAAIYLLNAKRADLADIEERYGVVVEVIPEGENEGAKMRVASSGPRPENLPEFSPIVYEDEDDDADIVDEDEADEENGERVSDEGEDGDRRRRRKRRRGGRGRDRAETQGRQQDSADGEAADTDRSDEVESEDESGEASESEGIEAGAEGEGRRKRRRGGRRRRGRGRDGDLGGEGQEAGTESGDSEADSEAGDGNAEVQPEPAPEPVLVEAEAPAMGQPEAEEGPAKPKRTRRKKAEPVDTEAVELVAGAQPEAAPLAEALAEEPPAKPKRTRRKKSDETATVAEAELPAGEAEEFAEPVAEAAAKAPRKPRARRATAKAARDVAETRVAEAARPDDMAVEADVGMPAAAEAEAEGGEATGEPRRGWWQRTFGN